MLNRQSSSSPLSLALFRSRSASPSRSATSCRVGWCALSHPFFCQSLKLIAISHQEHLLALQHPAHKWVPHPQFLPPLLRRQHIRIDFPANFFLLTTQQRIDLVDAKPPIFRDDQHIDITTLMLLAPRKRPKNK